MAAEQVLDGADQGRQLPGASTDLAGQIRDVDPPDHIETAMCSSNAARLWTSGQSAAPCR